MRFIFIGLIFLLAGCLSSSKTIRVPLSERHQPSGLNSHFKSNDASSFDDYQTITRKMIAAARTDLGGADGERIIDGNAPFNLKPSETCPPGKDKPYRRGVLVTHGLTDSPYTVRALGDFFRENCFRVMAILLPGHGTRPGDLLETTWKDWVQAERFGVNALASEVDEVYLSGFSTGGALSVLEGLHDRRVKGLFLFAPALRISSLAALGNWHKVYSWASPRARWSDLLEDSTPFRYESFTFNAIDQIHLLTKEVRSAFSDQAVTIPVFIAASEDDTTVSTPETVGFFRKATNPLNRMILYSAKATPAPDPTGRVEVVNSLFPEQKILSSAHTAIVIPPSDPHYGKEGDYANCMHYFGKAPEKYAFCKGKKEDFQGELTDENLGKWVVRRPMYNPNYDALKVTLKKFIDTLP